MGITNSYRRTLQKNHKRPHAEHKISEPLSWLDLTLQVMAGIGSKGTEALESFIKCTTTRAAKCSSIPEGQPHYSLASHYARYYTRTCSFSFILLSNRIKSPFAQRTKCQEEWRVFSLVLNLNNRRKEGKGLLHIRSKMKKAWWEQTGWGKVRRLLGVFLSLWAFLSIWS